MPVNQRMKSNKLVPTLLLAAGFAAGTLSFAAQKKPAADAEAIAQARKSYPMKQCLVSDEALGSMGEAAGYVHRQAGKPDRVIFVCCEGCIDDFKADPAKYLKKLDDAEAAAKKGTPTGSAPSGKEEAKKS